MKSTGESQTPLQSWARPGIHTTSTGPGNTAFCRKLWRVSLFFGPPPGRSWRRFSAAACRRWSWSPSIRWMPCRTIPPRTFTGTESSPCTGPASSWATTRPVPSGQTATSAAPSCPLSSPGWSGRNTGFSPTLPTPLCRIPAWTRSSCRRNCRSCPLWMWLPISGTIPIFKRPMPWS